MSDTPPNYMTAEELASWCPLSAAEHAARDGLVDWMQGVAWTSGPEVNEIPASAIDAVAVTFLRKIHAIADALLAPDGPLGLAQARNRELETKLAEQNQVMIDAAREIREATADMSSKLVINHRDGDPTNNELANLEVVEHPEWDRTYAVGDPDPTPDLDRGYCMESTVSLVSGRYTVCTWPRDHRGDHVAGNDAVILAVWPREGT